MTASKTVSPCTGALHSLLRRCAPHICGLLCPSVKRESASWTHVDLCNEITTALEKVPGETLGEPDAWLVIGPDGWRYLSAGEGDARMRAEKHRGEIHPLYRRSVLQSHRS